MTWTGRLVTANALLTHFDNTTPQADVRLIERNGYWEAWAGGMRGGARYTKVCLDADPVRAAERAVMR